MKFADARLAAPIGLATALATLLGACRQLPNRNDLSQVPVQERAHQARELLIATSDVLAYKVDHNLLTDEERLELIEKRGRELLTKIDRKSVPIQDVWKYAELLRLTRRWDQAAAEFELALKAEKDPGQTVFLSLRLSHCLAKLGKSDEALKTAFSVMDAPPAHSAPILPAVLYEIVPALEGKADRGALSRLLTKAMAAHSRTAVDRESEAGRLFIAARRTHLTRAQRKIIELSSAP